MKFIKLNDVSFNPEFVVSVIDATVKNTKEGADAKETKGVALMLLGAGSPVFISGMVRDEVVKLIEKATEFNEHDHDDFFHDWPKFDPPDEEGC